MATNNNFHVIDVIDLTWVIGGLDKQTQAAKAAIDQATSAAFKIAKSVGPQDDSASQMMMHMMSQRRSGGGPTGSPALPPTSHLTR
jgi:hypothetical protein